MKKAILFVFMALIGTAQAQPFTKKFILAFHTVDDGCNNPQCHETHLAESDDGFDWSLVPNFPVYNGSVPDVIVRNGKLYLYNPGKVKRYNAANLNWENQTGVSLLDSAGNTVNFVDPSPILDENGNIVLFFLNSTGSVGDPATCNPYPCTKVFDSAIEVNGSDGTQFLLQPGHRYSVTLQSGTASDPDIYYDGSDYVLYISQGTNTLAFHSPDLHGDYASFQNLQTNLLTNQGGIPCGIYDEEEDQYLTYVHQNQGSSTVIRAAAHDDFSQQAQGFQTVMDAQTAGLDVSVKCESPGICTNDFLTGIQPVNEYARSFTIYPNPISEDHFLLEVDHRLIGENLIITDLMGQVILEKKITGDHMKIESVNLAPGIYFAGVKGRVVRMVKK